MADKSLSDDDVFELLHAAWLLMQGKTVDTPLGRDVIATMIRDIELLQRAMIIKREGREPDGIRPIP